MDSQFQNKEDFQIWSAFVGGNPKALIFIYDNYVDLLFNYGKRITGDADIIKDGIQDLFIELWDRRAHLGKVNSIKNYLFISLRRKLLKTIDSGRRLDSLTNKEADHENLLKDQPYEFKLILEEFDTAKYEKLMEEINNLPARQKEALFLKFYDNMSNADISTVMDLNVQSVYNLIHQAISSLKENMEHYIYLSSLFIFFLLF